MSNNSFIKNYKKKYNENGELIESSFSLDVGNIILNTTIKTLKEFLEKHDESEFKDGKRKELEEQLNALLELQKIEGAGDYFLAQNSKHCVKKDFHNVKRKKSSANKVQLAHNFSGKNFDNPYYSRKFDGKRMYILNGKPYSRTNKECSLEPIEHITNELSTLNFIDDYVLDGECLYFDKNGKEDFKKVISLTSRDKRSKDCSNICYVIFDAIPKENFINKTPFVDFKSEYQWLIDNLADFDKPTPCYSLIATKLNNVYIARQETDINKLQELRVQNKWEGLMVRNGDAPYEYKRTQNLLKIKKMLDGEFDIVGFTEGTGKFIETLGAVTIKLLTGETVNVGCGFNIDDRNYIWENKEDILKSGYKLKVQYFEKTQDKNGNNSLRFPVFKAFRKNSIEYMRVV